MSLQWDNNSWDVAAHVAIRWHQQNRAAYAVAATAGTMGSPAVLIHSVSAKSSDPAPQPSHEDEQATVSFKVVRTMTKADLRALEAHDHGAPPAFCEKVVCLLVPPDDQESRLGDYEEYYRTRWMPKFGPALAKWVYVWHVLCDSPILVRIGVGLRMMFGR